MKFHSRSIQNFAFTIRMPALFDGPFTPFIRNDLFPNTLRDCLVLLRWTGGHDIEPPDEYLMHDSSHIVYGPAVAELRQDRHLRLVLVGIVLRVDRERVLCWNRMVLTRW